MPSPFAKRPKSDLRLEWKNLKARYAKPLTAAKIKIEIGLGKELDGYQKAINQLLAIDEKKLTKADLNPVLLAGQKVRKSVGVIKPKVQQGYPEMVKFLTRLEADVVWWNQAAGKVAVQPRHAGGWELTNVPLAVQSLIKARPLVPQIDALVAQALKNLGGTKPSRFFEYWVDQSKALRPILSKLRVVNKDNLDSFELMRELLADNKKLISDIPWTLGGLQDINPNDYPKGLTDWNKLKQLSKALEDLLDDAGRVADGLKG